MHGLFDEKFFEDLSKRKFQEVFVLEGRPSLKSSRSICTQLLKHKIKPTIIADNMAGFLFYKNLIKEVCMSYQSFGKEDGALCLAGGLILSVLAKNHKVMVKVYPTIEDSLLIAKPKEVLHFNGERVAPRGVKGYAPLVEWVPKKYINKIL